MKLSQLTVGLVATNCYILGNDAGECIIVDPGEEAARIKAKLRADGLLPAAILLTHGHFDHIGAVNALTGEYGCPVYIGENDENMLHDPGLNSCGFGIGAPITVDGAKTLADDEVITPAGFSIRTIFTPGHTPGGVCYYLEDEGILFSGDTLFCMSVGRTDFPGGSTSTLVRSIKEKLFLLPDDTKVYSGHGEETTIGFEKTHNYFL